jgi:hypothetical protein
MRVNEYANHKALHARIMRVDERLSRVLHNSVIINNVSTN